MQKDEKCIYCGQRETTRHGDHVPPQKFFPKARYHPLIQVPCCINCHTTTSADDELVRNLLISIEQVEQHPVIESELRETCRRSLVKEKKKGGVTKRNLQHLIDNTYFKDRYSKGGIYVGRSPVLNFDQPKIQRFLARMARALHHYRYNTGFLQCEIVSSNVIDDKLEQYFKTHCPTSNESFGKDVFSFAEFSANPKKCTFWLMTFYGSIEFWVQLKPCAMN